MRFAPVVRLFLMALALNFLDASSVQTVQGIYVLDDDSTELRDSNIRDYDFVAGYAWRVRWDVLEPKMGQYDFSSVDNILERLQEVGKKLSLSVAFQPSYLARAAKFPNLVWENPNYQSRNRQLAPWDPNCLLRYKALMEQLSNYQVWDRSGRKPKKVSLRDHPTLALIRGSVCGIRHVRDNYPELGDLNIYDLPGYSRHGFYIPADSKNANDFHPGYVDAVKLSLEAITQAFPEKAYSIGFWAVEDEQVGGSHLWEDLLSMIETNFQGRVGLFQENLAAVANRPEVKSKDRMVQVTPDVSWPNSAPLLKKSFELPVYFQALQSWSNPFRPMRDVDNAYPSDAIEGAYKNFGAKYFELYVDDVDNPDPKYRSGLKYWGKFLSK